MTVQLLIDETPFGVRGAVLQDEVPTRLLHNFHADRAPQTGELFWARVGKRDARLGALICKLGEAGEGLLPVKDKAYTEGQTIAVAIRREGFGDKRPLLTDRPLLKLPAATYSLDPDADPRPGPMGQIPLPDDILATVRGDETKVGRLDRVPSLVGLITALASSGVTEILCSSEGLVPKLKPYVPDTIEWDVSGTVSTILDDIEDDALARTIALEGGGSLVIDQTEALTAVDLDLGASVGFSKKGADAGLLRRAISALGPILSLHGIGGQVVADFPRGATRAPKMIRDQLTAALKPYGLMSVPAVTKEGLVIMIFGHDRMPTKDRLTEEVGGSFVRPPRRLRPVVHAQRAYSALREALASNPSGTWCLALPDETGALWKDSQASEALIRVYTKRFTITKSDDDNFHIETAL